MFRDRDLEKHLLLRGLLEWDKKMARRAGLAHAATAPTDAHRGELRRLIAEWLDSQSPDSTDRLRLSYQDAELVRHALYESERVPELDFEVYRWRYRSALAQDELRNKEKNLGVRKTRALQILDLIPEGGKLRKLPEGHVVVRAYHCLTTEQGSVLVQDDIDWALDEDRKRRERVDDCPIEPREAVKIIARVFGFGSEKSCQRYLEAWQELLRELRESSQDRPNVVAALPELKLPYTWDRA